MCSVRICSLASGSSGNCYYVGTDNTHVLVDAGISCKRIIQSLEDKIGISGKDLDGVFVSHEHNDHIQSLGVLARKFKTPLYATQGTWQGIGDKIGKVEPELYNTLDSQGSLEIGDLHLEWFSTSHDALEPIGFVMENENKRVGIATDSGILTNRMKKNLFNVDYLILEANHDERMLINGTYPGYLKRRILSNKGHLSNRAAGEALLDLIGEKTCSVTLAHLSQQNNTPSLALKTVEHIFREINSCIPVNYRWLHVHKQAHVLEYNLCIRQLFKGGRFMSYFDTEEYGRKPSKVGYFLVAIIGAIIGGLLSLYLAPVFYGGNLMDNNPILNQPQAPQISNTEVDFSPVVAIAEQVGPTVVGVSNRGRVSDFLAELR